MEELETEEERQVGLPRFSLGSRVVYHDEEGARTGVIVAVCPDDEHPYAVCCDPIGAAFIHVLVREDNDDCIELLQEASGWNDDVWQSYQAEPNRGDGAWFIPGEARMVVDGINGDYSYAVSKEMATKIASLLHGTVRNLVHVTFDGDRLRYCDQVTIRTLARSIINANRIELVDYPSYAILQTLAESDSLNVLLFDYCDFPTPNDVDCECWAKICSITRNIEFHEGSFEQITPLLEESLKQGFQQNKSLDRVDLHGFSHPHCLIGAFHGAAAPKKLSLSDNGNGRLAISEIQVLYHEFFISQLKLEKPALESLYLGEGFEILVSNDCFLSYDILKELKIECNMTTSVAVSLGPWLAETKNLRSLSLGRYFVCAEHGCKAVLNGLSRNKSLEKLTFPVFACESDYEAFYRIVAADDDDGSFTKVKELVSAIKNSGIRSLTLVGGRHDKNQSSAQALRDNLVDLQSLRSLDISDIFYPANAPIAEAFLEGLNDGLMFEELIWDKSKLPPNTSFPQEEMLLKTNCRINKLVPAVGQHSGRLAPSVWSVILSLVSPKAYGIYQVLQADPTCGGLLLPKDDTPKRKTRD